jgi:hypothetical protein
VLTPSAISIRNAGAKQFLRPPNKILRKKLKAFSRECFPPNSIFEGANRILLTCMFEADLLFRVHATDEPAMAHKA